MATVDELFDVARAIAHADDAPAAVPDLVLVRHFMKIDGGVVVYFDTGADRDRWMAQAGLVR